MSSTIIIPLDFIFDQNKMINKALNNRYAYASAKKQSTEAVSLEVRSQVIQNKIDWKFPGKMTFVWHLNNLRKDADNISSSGRKSILDGMQAATVYGNKFLKNDSLKFINAFEDVFILNRDLKKGYVEIFFEQQELKIEKQERG